jgi:hypothetical protein
MKTIEETWVFGRICQGVDSLLVDTAFFNEAMPLFRKRVITFGVALLLFFLTNAVMELITPLGRFLPDTLWAECIALMIQVGCLGVSFLWLWIAFTRLLVITTPLKGKYVELLTTTLMLSFVMSLPAEGLGEKEFAFRGILLLLWAMTCLRPTLFA